MTNAKNDWMSLAAIPSLRTYTRPRTTPRLLLPRRCESRGHELPEQLLPVLLHELDDLPVAVGVLAAVEAGAGAGAVGREQRAVLLVPDTAGVAERAGPPRPRPPLRRLRVAAVAARSLPLPVPPPAGFEAGGGGAKRRWWCVGVEPGLGQPGRVAAGDGAVALPPWRGPGGQEWGEGGR
jgi:hypothetical protein